MTVGAFNKAAKSYTAAQRDAGRELIAECMKQRPDVGWITLSVTKNASLTETDSAGNTLLMKVMNWGNLELTKTLLKYGAPVNQANNRGETPLHVAATLNVLVVDLLLEHGADYMAQTKSGKRASDICSMDNNPDAYGKLIKLVNAKLAEEAAAEAEAIKRNLVTQRKMRGLKPPRFKSGA